MHRLCLAFLLLFLIAPLGALVTDAAGPTEPLSHSEELLDGPFEEAGSIARPSVRRASPGIGAALGPGSGARFGLGCRVAAAETSGPTTPSTATEVARAEIARHGASALQEERLIPRGRSG